MITNIRLLLFAAMMLFFTGCSSTAPLSGMLYSNIKYPAVNQAKMDAQTSEKKGVASCKSVLGMVAWGDCSIKQAMNNGAIQKLHHVDVKSKNIYVFWFQYETQVWGE